jgi:DNA-binding MarR family transcriptional regulator
MTSHDAGAAVFPAMVRGASRSDDLASFARHMLWSRRQRERRLPEIDFGEPAWDMMLDLYVSHVECRPLSVSDLCLSAGVPTTTAMRRIRAMIAEGHLVNERDEQDRRRVHVRLSTGLVAKMEALLLDMRRKSIYVTSDPAPEPERPRMLVMATDGWNG